MRQVNGHADASVAAVLRALGHPTRVWLVRRLSAGDACVCEMLLELQISQPVFSQHLQVLRHAGILRSRRDGNRVIYGLRHPGYAHLIAAAAETIGRQPAVGVRE